MGTNDGATATSTGRALEPLRPESLYSLDASIRYDGSRVQASFTGYTTQLRDAIVR